ncbi:MAG: alpha-ketoacid dehydrogenase subunit beta, partial [Candidatus Sigynarchaeota archaeon]
EIMFMDFITLAMDPIVNQAAKLRYVLGSQARCPCVIRAVAGAGRCYGPTHSQSLEAWFVHVPGLIVVSPATPADAKGLLKAALRSEGPVIFIEHKLLYNLRGPVSGDPGKVLPPDGSDRNPYHIRDLGTIFFIQAVSAYLLAAEKKEK